MFSCDFCEISKNTFFYRTPLVAAFAKKRYYPVFLTVVFEQCIIFETLAKTIHTIDHDNLGLKLF